MESCDKRDEGVALWHFGGSACVQEEYFQSLTRKSKFRVSS